MRDSYLPFCRPTVGEEEVAEVVDALRSGWLTTGARVARFEAEFAAFIGTPSAVALASCSAALHTALSALGVGPGDGIITSTMTFCGAVHAIEHVGARPILVDVEPDTLNPDPAAMEEALHALACAQQLRIGAILPVHLYGHPSDLDAIMGMAQDHQVPVVHDAAHALPARYKGRTIGAFGTLTAFSFYATKNLTTAEGGMLTGDPELLEEARLLSLHGMSKDAYQRDSAQGSWAYDVMRCGFKYNMTDIQAAIGLHQLCKLPVHHLRRQEIAQRYTTAFSEREELQPPVQRPDVDHAWHLYVLRLNTERLSISRDRFIEEMRALNIGCSVHFAPIHMLQYYRQKYHYVPSDFPVAYREFQRIVSLPLYPGMTDHDVSDVIEAVLDVVRRYRK